MAWLDSKRPLFLASVAVLLAGAALVAYVTIGDGTVLGLGGPPRLKESTAEISMTIEMTLPDQIDTDQSLKATGLVNFPQGRAAVHYDLTGLTNAAGFFGNLQQFRVLFAEDGMYVRIFSGAPQWVLLKPEELAELRVGRLREVALSSPLLAPLVVHRRGGLLTNPDSSGSYDVEVSDIEPVNGAQSWLVELLEAIDARVIEVDPEFQDGFPVLVEFTFRFPVTEVSSDNAAVTVRTSLTPSGSESIGLPERANFRAWSEFYE